MKHFSFCLHGGYEKFSKVKQLLVSQNRCKQTSLQKKGREIVVYC